MTIDRLINAFEKQRNFAATENWDYYSTHGKSHLQTEVRSHLLFVIYNCLVNPEQAKLDESQYSLSKFSLDSSQLSKDSQCLSNQLYHLIMLLKDIPVKCSFNIKRKFADLYENQDVFHALDKDGFADSVDGGAVVPTFELTPQESALMEKLKITPIEGSALVGLFSSFGVKDGRGLDFRQTVSFEQTLRDIAIEAFDALQQLNPSLVTEYRYSLSAKI